MSPSDLAQSRAPAEPASSLAWHSGLDGRCASVNAAWLGFTGRALAEELGDGWTASVHPDDLRCYLTEFWKSFDRRESFESTLRLRRRDGAYRAVRVTATPFQDSSGAFAGFSAHCIDSHGEPPPDEFTGGAEFFEMSLDLLCIAGFDGYFKRVNPAWSKALGWTPQELCARPLIEFVHPEDRAATLAGRMAVKASEPLLGLHNRYLCKDGSYRWLEWKSVGHLERQVVYATARDVTQQREAERVLQEAKELQALMQRQLIMSDRLASVGMLAAGVAHEINNPLSYVMSNLELLAEQLEQAKRAAIQAPLDEWRDSVEEAREGSQRIRKIVRGLKTLSRAEAELRAVIPLRPVLELSVNMAFNEIRHRARLVKDYGDTPFVEADDARLGQVFINLLINAAHAIPEGDSDSNEVRIVTSTDARGRAVIEILDTGTGIPAEALGRVFDPFFTTKAIGVGTGLGLSICHSIVTSMGGEISASNREKRGACLRVVLNPALPLTQQAARTVPAAVSLSRRARVLVVDDEQAVAAALVRVLSLHDVTAFNSAREALDLLATGAPFDIIFSDLMMPGISGDEFYESLSREHPELASRTVFMSGGAFTPTARAFLESVPNERIEKPFDISKVRQLVQKAVG